MVGVRSLLISAFILLLSISIGSWSDVPPEQEAEVEHLINYLAESDCQMARNGKSHNGKDGASHVRRKYAHFRKEISNTENFIRYSATKSTISGRYYEVQCPGEVPVRSQDWLLKELKVYRSR